MRKIALALCLLTLLLHLPCPAQNNQQVEEQLASSLFQKQDYEKAKEVYHELFKKNPERPPFAEFAHWVDANVSLYLTDCSRPAMSVAYKALNGARYPWKNTQMSPNILFRWRAMYQILNKLWEEVSSTRSLPEKARSLHETASDE